MAELQPSPAGSCAALGVRSPLGADAGTELPARQAPAERRPVSARFRPACRPARVVGAGCVGSGAECTRQCLSWTVRVKSVGRGHSRRRSRKEPFSCFPQARDSPPSPSSPRWPGAPREGVKCYGVLPKSWGSNQRSTEQASGVKLLQDGATVPLERLPVF